MPLYDCMLLLKPHIKNEAVMDLMAKVGKHVYRRNGVLTDIQFFGTIQLGYGIKKLDGRYYQGRLGQMTMMTPPSFNNELHYLNKEDRLLRWLLVKHRDIKFGQDFFSRDDSRNYEVTRGRDDPTHGDFRDFIIELPEEHDSGGGFLGVAPDEDSTEDDDNDN